MEKTILNKKLILKTKMIFKSLKSKPNLLRKFLIRTKKRKNLISLKLKFPQKKT